MVMQTSVAKTRLSFLSIGARESKSYFNASDIH